MSWMLEGRALDSILISRLRYLGDVVMATPLLEVLRRGDPGLRIGFLAENNHGQILQGHPHLDQLHLLKTDRHGADAEARKGGQECQGALGARAMVSHLRQSSYDLAVDLFFNPRSAWLLRVAGIGQRICGTRGSRRWLYSHTVIPSENPERFKNLYLSAPGGMAEHLGRLAPLVHRESKLPFLDWFEREYEGQILAPQLPREYWAQKMDPDLPGVALSSISAPIVLVPSATWPTKEWPLEHWKELVMGLLQATEGPLYVIQPPGGNSVWSTLDKIIPSDRGRVLPVLKLPQVLGVISNSALLVSVDGGIMHAGVGLGIATIGLFGPTDPSLWFPYEKAGPFRVLATKPHCAPCDLHQCESFICLPELKPRQVLDQCLEFLGKGGE